MLTWTIFNYQCWSPTDAVTELGFPSVIILLILNNSAFLKMNQWTVPGRQLHPPKIQTFRWSGTIFLIQLPRLSAVKWNIIYFIFEKSAVLLVTEKKIPFILRLHSPYWQNTTYWCAQVIETGGTERLSFPPYLQSVGTMQIECVHKTTENQTWPNMAWNYLCTPV